MQQCHTPNQPVERWNFQKTILLSVRGFAHLDRWLAPTSLPQLEPANSNLPPRFCRDICVCYGQLRPPPVHQQISTWVGWAPELVEVSCLQYVQTSNPEEWCSPCGGVAYSWPILLMQCFQQAAASKMVQPCYRVCRAYVFEDIYVFVLTNMFFLAGLVPPSVCATKLSGIRVCPVLLICHDFKHYKYRYQYHCLWHGHWHYHYRHQYHYNYHSHSHSHSHSRHHNYHKRHACN